MDFNLALRYAQNRRAFQPAIYNERRMKEYSSDVECHIVKEPAIVDLSVGRLNELSEIIKQLNVELGDEDLTVDADDDDNQNESFEVAHDDYELDEESIPHDDVEPANDIDLNENLVENDALSGNHLYKLNVR